MNPTWSKGYARKGAALHGLRRYPEAIEAYETGLKIEDSAVLRKGLKEVIDAKGKHAPPRRVSPRALTYSRREEADERGDGAEAFGLGKMFGDPALLAKLAANPRTAKHLSDPAFVQRLQLFQKNPKLAENALQDPRMIDVLGALMGIDMQGFAREEGSAELPPGVSRADAQSQSQSPPPAATSPPPQPTASSSKAPEPAKEEDVEMLDEEEATAKKQAEEEKKLGAEAYKARDFEKAIVHFQKAWDLYPKDITFLTNLAAAYFEKGDFDETIKTCEKAIEEGREVCTCV